MAEACKFKLPNGKEVSEQEFKMVLLEGGLEQYKQKGQLENIDISQLKPIDKTEPKEQPPSQKPPKPPTDSQGTDEGGEFQNNPKAILTRIFNSKNVSKNFKDLFENDPKGLRYNPQSHDTARRIAKEIIDEFGTENSVAMAESGRFDGDVNSMIFAEAIDRTFQAEQDAVTQEAKIMMAERWADYAMRYDETARQKGRFISAIYDFYKKSPLGVILAERTKRDEAFKEWFKNRGKDYKEVFEALKDEPEFKEFVKEKVQDATKQTRAANRMKRRQKINDIFNSAKIGTQGVNSAIIPPQIWNAAVEVMKQAALAGESIANVIQLGVDYVKANHADAWDEQAFRDEWNDKLGSMDATGKAPLTTEEKQQRILDRFRKKLSGLSEEQKEEVIRRSFKKLVDAGALEYDDFKKIIADVIGLGELSAEDTAKLTGFVKDMNAVQDAADNVMKQTDPAEIRKAIAEFDKVAKTAERSATKLAGMLYNKPQVGQRIRSIIQLNTLGLASLVKNVGYNVFHQLFVRIPKAVFGTILDQTIYGMSLLANKVFGSPVLRPDVNIFLAQQGYFSKGAEGTKQAVKQVFTGLTNKDYFQKEVYQSQIKPWTSIKDLWNWGRGKKNLTKGQIADKAIQATVGIPAEMVARGLNIGDKPFRFAAEGAAANTIAISDFKLSGAEKERFIRFPKEEAKQIYLKRGLSEEDATKKAEEVEKRIITAGEEAVFQQNNMVADAMDAIKKSITPKEGEVHPLGEVSSQVVKLFGLLNMPYVKTPVNIAWEVFNLINPEVALMQSLAYGYQAAKKGSRADFIKSKKWLSHAAVGYGLLSATAYLASMGAISGDDEDETYKAKEAKGKATFEKPHRLNVSKMLRVLSGGSPNDEDGDVNVDLSWFGATGVMMNYQANKFENMTKEEREAMSYVSDLLLRLNRGAQDGLVNSAFQGTISAIDALKTGNANNYLPSILNVLTNFVEPATIAQISRATRPYEYQLKDDSLPERLQNDLKARFFGKVTPKVNIWGEKIPKDVSAGNVALTMLGINKTNIEQFGRPIFEDFKRTGNSQFLPPAVTNKFSFEGQEIKLNTDQLLQLETLVGAARKNTVAPFINDAGTVGGSRYSEMTDQEKLTILQKLYDISSKMAKMQFIQLNPEVLTQNK